MNLAPDALTRKYPMVHWSEAGETRSARWRSESGNPPPARVVVADDQTSADAAYRLARSGTALLWRGDFQNARQLLQALTRRVEKPPHQPAAQAAARSAWGEPNKPLLDAFQQQRQQQARRAQTLGMLLLPLDADYSVPLRRAPDLRQACAAAYGPTDSTDTQPSLVSLRELLGLIGAYEWRKKGVPVAALGARIHPHYGVFAPIRGEYVDLVANAPLPDTAPEACRTLVVDGENRPRGHFLPDSPPHGCSMGQEPGEKGAGAVASQPTIPKSDRLLAFDIGTGTGVLAAVLARRGVARVLATDQDPRALACARENLQHLGLDKQVEVIAADLYPPGRADLIVCNPPWLPAQPSSAIEHAVYDPDSRMLLGFLNGLAAHLTPHGEGWLILSDLAEHLGLRSRAELLAAIEAAGLKVIARSDVRPQHPRAADQTDPLHRARAAEVTSLWRLAAA